MKKPNLIQQLTVLILIVVCILAPVSFAAAGNERGNGGDEYSKDFIQLGLDVWQTLERMPVEGVNNNDLLRAIQRTSVSSKLSLTLNGNEVDAINYPDAINPHIDVSRSGWDRMGISTHRRAFLVFHEYLGILGVDDSQFHVSLQLDSARACPRNFSVRAELERRTKKMCYDISNDDLHFVAGTLSLGSLNGSPIASEITSWDFAGLDNISKISFWAVPVTLVRAAAFDFLPQLEDVSRLGARELERFHSHPKLRRFESSEQPISTIADGAFQELRALEELSIYVDGTQVNIADALKGMPMLKKLSVRATGISNAPEFFNDYVRSNPNLREFSINLDDGDPSNLIPALEAVGFRRLSWNVHGFNFIR